MFDTFRFLYFFLITLCLFCSKELLTIKHSLTNLANSPIISMSVLAIIHMNWFCSLYSLITGYKDTKFSNNIFLCCLYNGHRITKWNSSSHSLKSQNVHNLSLGSLRSFGFAYLPVSM